ncbi:MAG TPA: hypothetical protein VF172_01590 [Nitrososphaera sp.]|jgi:hypothetical protein
MSDELNNNDLERRLSGRTLQVYLYLQKRKQPAGIREVQRDLGLSSPSVAEYQIEKLVEMGLASRDSYARVYVTKRVKVKAMQSYVNLGRFMVPRLAFYGSVFTAATALYVIFSYDSLSPYGVAVPSGAAAIFWFETWKMWKQSLIEKAAKKPPAEKDYFWASLVPGLAALGVFISAAFFLFNYVAPSGTVVTSVPPVDPNSPLYSPSPGNPVSTSDFSDVLMRHPGDSPLLGFSEMQVTVLLFGGALVAGFLIYVLIRCRCSNSNNAATSSVLTLGQDWN